MTLHFVNNSTDNSKQHYNTVNNIHFTLWNNHNSIRALKTTYTDWSPRRTVGSHSVRRLVRPAQVICAALTSRKLVTIATWRNEETNTRPVTTLKLGQTPGLKSCNVIHSIPSRTATTQSSSRTLSTASAAALTPHSALILAFCRCNNTVPVPVLS